MLARNGSGIFHNVSVNEFCKVKRNGAERRRDERRRKNYESGNMEADFNLLWERKVKFMDFVFVCTHGHTLRWAFFFFFDGNGWHFG